MEKVKQPLLRFRINVRILNHAFTELTCNPVKREQTLALRALDFAESHKIFSQLHFTKEDLRQDYGERRFVTFGSLDGLLVVLVWTERFPALHVISLRRANRRERKTYQALHN